MGGFFPNFGITDEGIAYVPTGGRDLNNIETQDDREREALQ